MYAGSREAFAAGRLAVGTRLGKYEILRFIAEGGMGELYVARASGIEGFEKTVALKRILSRFATRDSHVRMFLDEAKLAATLHHPNIVQVFDIGDERGVLFFSMEYVHGTDARSLLDAARDRAKPVPLEAALEIATGVAAGLHHAHGAGVIHRDVSPSNVLVAHDGGVKVTDFGVAKIEEGGDTHSGVLKGKVSYMSPEQCRGDALDRRSDVFAIGILLYELTTLEKPFTGTSDFATMERIVHHDAAPPSAKHTEYPRELEAIVMKALARDKAARYATAQELQRELRAFARDRKLDVSTLALESYLRELFGRQVNVWREAEVQATLPQTAVTIREPKMEVKLPTAPHGPRRWPLALAGGAVIAGGIAAWQLLGSPTSSAGVVDAKPAAPMPAVAKPDPVVANPNDGKLVDTAANTTQPAKDTSAKPVASANAVKRPKTPAKRIEPPKVAPPPVEPVVETPKQPPPAAGSAAPREVPWDPDSPTLPKRH